MVRRSINTTKSGKYMNPTDQARKEARKRELKKNKRQRQMVRANVLMGKDPEQILKDLLEVDKMEFNVQHPPPLSDKVLKDKRKKLRDTFTRVLKMHEKESDPKIWLELKQKELEYDRSRNEIIAYYESVKHAEEVQLDNIPLPPNIQMTENMLFGNMPSQIPLPADSGLLPPKPILKKDTAYRERPPGVEPPGVPPGPPVDFNTLLETGTIDKLDKKAKDKKSLRFADINDEVPPGESAPLPNPGMDKMRPPERMDEDPSEDVRAMHENPAQANAADAIKQHVSSVQQRMLQLAGQNVNAFIKERQEALEKKQKDRAADLNARLIRVGAVTAGSDSDSEPETAPAPVAPRAPPLEPPGAELVHPPPLLPPGMRAPPLRPTFIAPAGGVMRLGPPGLVLGLPPGPPPGLPPRLMRPPGPPPGAPPRLLRPPPPHQLPPKPQPVLSAAPQLHVTSTTPQGATITAKPQIRNRTADACERFVPISVLTKRENKKSLHSVKTSHQIVSEPKPASSKDADYKQFMEEIQPLL